MASRAATILALLAVAAVGAGCRPQTTRARAGPEAARTVREPGPQAGTGPAASSRAACTPDGAGRRWSGPERWGHIARGGMAPRVVAPSPIACVALPAPVTDAEFSADGSMLAVSSGADANPSVGAMELLDGRTGRLRRSYVTGQAVTGIRFLADGRMASYQASPGVLRSPVEHYIADLVCFWEPASGSPLQRVRVGNEEGAISRVIDISPDGTTAVLDRWPNAKGVLVWRIGARTPVTWIGGGWEGSMVAGTFSPDGRYYAHLQGLVKEAAGAGACAIFDTSDWRMRGRYGVGLRPTDEDFYRDDLGEEVAFSPDGRCLAVAARRTPVLGVPNATVRCRIGVPSANVALSPDGRTAALGLSAVGTSGHDEPNWVMLCDLSGHAMAVWLAHSNTLAVLRFSPGGTVLVSGGRDCTVKLWSVPDLLALAPEVGGSEATAGGVATTDH